MKDILIGFKNYMEQSGKSENTSRSYILHVREYLNWFQDTYGLKCSKLYHENILEYKSYLSNVKRYRGKPLNARTVNAKLSALKLFNQYLIDESIQEDMVITNKDLIKIQTDIANATDLNKEDVENLRQKILESGDKRLYAITTLLAYSGLRISEALNIRLDDMSLEGREIIIRKGKGDKQRIVYLNTRIINAIKEYFKVRKSNSQYLFPSRESDKVDRSVINKDFKKHSNSITPHALRHFYCTHALESGFSVHEVANLAGHSSIQTTLIYTNPSRKAMKGKAELL